MWKRLSKERDEGYIKCPEKTCDPFYYPYDVSEIKMVLTKPALKENTW